MALRFNRIVQTDQRESRSQMIAENVLSSKTARDKLLFMSHKTGDDQAEAEARYIAKIYGVQVYMTEWDDYVEGDSNQLPDYIMNAIRKSDGFLVNVIAEIAVSMWIGYEIGGAHAMQKDRAKVMYRDVGRLPSVVAALRSLRNRRDLDWWIRTYILRS